MQLRKILSVSTAFLILFTGALNAETGEILYEIRNNIYGTLLALSTDYEILVMTYQFTRYMLPSEAGGKRVFFTSSVKPTGVKRSSMKVNARAGFIEKYYFPGILHISIYPANC